MNSQRNCSKASSLGVLVGIFLMGQAAISTTIYVDDSAIGLGNGNDWEDAFLHLQNAPAGAAGQYGD